MTHKMAPTTKYSAVEDFADDFEVIKQTAEVAIQEDNDAITAEVARLHAVLSDLQSRTAEDSYASTLSIAELASKLEKLSNVSKSEFKQNGLSIDDLRVLLASLTKNTDLRSRTHDRRVRTLEYCFDDVEAGLGDAKGSIARLEKQVQQESSERSADVTTLQAAVDANEMKAHDNSVRLDRMVIKYLPSIEAKLHDVKEETTQKHAVLDSKLHDVSKKLDLVTASDLSDIRRIAAEANLRSRLVEQTLPAVKSDIYMAMAVEFDGVEADARKLRQTTLEHIERLSKASEIMESETDLLDRRVTWTEEVSSHMSRTVVPQLESRVREQGELLDRKDAEIKLAAQRETALVGRIANLEHITTRCVIENSVLVRRLKSMEDTVRDLVNEVRKPAQFYDAQVVDKELVVPTILDRGMQKHHFKVLPRALRAEIERRERRRFSKALRAEILRREISAEVLRRHEARPVAPPKSKISAFSLEAEIFRRMIRTEMAKIRSETIELLPKVSESALRAEILRREIKTEVARRQAKVDKLDVIARLAPAEAARYLLEHMESAEATMFLLQQMENLKV